jgi:hypothetical protein
MLPPIFLKSSATAVPLFVPANLALENDDDYRRWLDQCKKFYAFLKRNDVIHGGSCKYETDVDVECSPEGFLMAFDTNSFLDRLAHNDTVSVLREHRAVLARAPEPSPDPTIALFAWTHLRPDATFAERLAQLQSHPRSQTLLHPTSPFCQYGSLNLKLFREIGIDDGRKSMLLPLSAGEVADAFFTSEIIAAADFVFFHPTGYALIFANHISSREEAAALHLPWPPPDNRGYLHVPYILSYGFERGGKTLLLEAASLAFLLGAKTVVFASTARGVGYHYREQGARFVDHGFEIVDAEEYLLMTPEVLPLTDEQALEREMRNCEK